jgi:putative transposase
VPRWRLFYHVVWATHRREPVLDDRAAEVVERAIKAACREQAVILHAVGVMPDHVHVAASIPPAVSIASVVGRWKGSASHLLNHAERDGDRPPFAWQAEYGVLSFGEKALPDVIAYLQNQPTRHAAQRLWDALGQTTDRAQPASAGFVASARRLRPAHWAQDGC